MYNNSDILAQKLHQLAQHSGFLVFAIGDFYIQFYKDLGDDNIEFEAVSHHFQEKVPIGLLTEFADLGFIMNNENYWKSIDKTQIKPILAESEYIFTKLYNVDYNIPFEIQNNIELEGIIENQDHEINKYRIGLYTLLTLFAIVLVYIIYKQYIH